MIKLLYLNSFVISDWFVQFQACWGWARWLRIFLGGWLQMVLGGCRWFQVVCCFSSYSYFNCFVCVCVCVCINVQIYVLCLFLCTYVCTHVFMYSYSFVCIYCLSKICISLFEYLHIYVLLIFGYTVCIDILLKYFQKNSTWWIFIY